MSLSRGYDIVIGSWLLQHKPHRLDVVACIAPVASGIEVAKTKLLGQSHFNLCGSERDFRSHEIKSSSRTLMVEQNTGTRKQSMTLAIISRDPLGVCLRHSIGVARPKGSGLLLGHIKRIPKHFAAGCLAEAYAGIE